MHEPWFAHEIQKWYTLNKRDLPWRLTRDPYYIWLSEIILQQTRVKQGMPYYNRFIEQYKSINEFCEASLDDILKLWQGLGYYSRARNMHACAYTVVHEYNGKFPNSYSELLKLKGIGKYTAAAIASICFEEKVPTIDGNVYRLISRVFGLSDDISNSATFQVFFDYAMALMPNNYSGDFNQAMMEYGAIVCLPKKPDCQSCIFKQQCHAKKHDLISDLPVKSKKIKIRHRYLYYSIIVFKNSVLVQQRKASDIWKGLFQFHLTEQSKKEKHTLISPNARHLFDGASTIHPLTHQKLHIEFGVYTIENELIFNKFAAENDMIAVEINDIHDLAVAKPIELFLNNEFFPYFSAVL